MSVARAGSICWRRPSRAWWSATAGLSALFALAVWVLSSASPVPRAWWPHCIFHELTGLFCTGCGGTRAARALLHGDLALAWSMNPLAVLALPLVSVLWLDWGFGHRWAWLRPLRDARPWALAVLVFTVGRNLPWMPFAGWAPG